MELKEQYFFFKIKLSLKISGSFLKPILNSHVFTAILKLPLKFTFFILSLGDVFLYPDVYTPPSKRFFFLHGRHLRALNAYVVELTRSSY